MSNQLDNQFQRNLSSTSLSRISFEKRDSIITDNNHQQDDQSQQIKIDKNQTYQNYKQIDINDHLRPNNYQIKTNENEYMSIIEQENNQIFINQTSKETDFYFQSNITSNIDQKYFNTFNTSIQTELSEQILNDSIIYGQPTVINRNEKYLFIGTSCGAVIKYLRKDNFKTKKLMTIIKDHQKKGAVTAIDVSFDNKVMIIGYDGGNLDLYEIEKDERIEVFKDLHQSVILKIKFIHESTDSFIAQEFISTDERNNIIRSMVGVQKNFFDSKSASINSSPLFSPQDIQIINIKQGQLLNDCCIEISLLSQELPLKYFKKKMKLLACVFQYSGIVIVKVGQHNVTILHKIRRINFMENMKYLPPPVVSWGDAIFKSSADVNLVLLIGWGRYIFIVKLNYYDVELQFTNAVSALVEDNIQYCGFISNSIILVVYGKKIVIIHSNKFELSFKEKQTIADYYMGYELENQLNFEQDEIFVNGYQTNYRLFVCSLKDNILYFIHKNRMIISKLKKWQDFFSEKANATHDWLDLMQKAMLMYQGKIEYIGGLDSNNNKNNQIMKDFLQGLSLNFIEENFFMQNLSIIDDVQINKNLQIVSEFLLKTDNQEFLFTNILDKLKQIPKIYEKFFEVIEIFIENKKINKITNNLMIEVINYLKQWEKFEVIQKLILNLDLSVQDMQPVLKFSKDNGLILSLIYISTIQYNDFLTPFIKMQQIYDRYSHKKQYGYKILWYLKTLFQGKYINQVIIQNKKYIQALENILNYIMDENILNTIFLIDIKMVLNIFFMLFQGIPANIIQNMKKSFKLCTVQQINDPHSAIISLFMQVEISTKKEQDKSKEIIDEQFLIFYGKVFKLKKFEIQENIKFNLIKRFLKDPVYIYHVCNSLNDKINRDDYDQFKFSLMEINQDDQIEEEQEIEDHQSMFNSTASFNMNVSTFFDGGQNSLMRQNTSLVRNNTFMRNNSSIIQMDEQEKKQSRANEIASIEENDFKQNAFIIGIMLEMPNLISNTAQLNELFEISEFLQLSEVNCFILHNLGRYLDCFNKYFNAYNKLIKKRVFLWLNNVFVFEKQDLLPLKQLIIKNFQFLVQINSLEAKNLIQTHLKGLKVNIIQYLNQYPQEQLMYLKSIMNQEGDNYKPTDDEKVLYIQLLCNYEPDSVIQELQQKEFPLEKLLEIIKQNKNLLNPIAYILQRMGANQEALNIYIDLFLQQHTNIVKQLSQVSRNSSQMNSNYLTQKYDKGYLFALSFTDKKEIMIKLNNILNICQNSKKQDTSDEENIQLWFQLCDKYFKLVKTRNMTNKDIPQVIRDLFTDVISTIFENLCSNISLEFALDQFLMKYGSINLKVFQKANTVIQNFNFLKIINEQARNVVLDYNINLDRSILNQKVQGYNGFDYIKQRYECQICKKELNIVLNKNSLIFQFQCRHYCHMECILKYEQFNYFGCFECLQIQKSKELNKNQLKAICSQYTHQKTQLLEKSQQKELKGEQINSQYYQLIKKYISDQTNKKIAQNEQQNLDKYQLKLQNLNKFDEKKNKVYLKKKK